MNTLPAQYRELGDAEVEAAIWRAKTVLGEALTILGHHYQSDEVIQFADYRGDSLDLSRRAAQAARARYIVFCGVHFMAETAAILCQPEQAVLEPATESYCPMAHMADREGAVEAWEGLSAAWGGDLVPITYQNSTAELKAFVGEHGGAVCTSSNADKLFRWALARKNHVLFMPDEHLGTNTALAMGIPREQIGFWDPARPPSAASLAHCRVVVWGGYCHVHTCFTLQDVEAVKREYPDVRVIVHPECTHDVVAAADLAASTTGIIKAVQATAPGTTIAIGTEWHLVNRLSHEYPDRRILPLRPSMCKVMGLTTTRHLLYILEGLQAGILHNAVRVEEPTARWARVALERMLEAS